MNWLALLPWIALTLLAGCTTPDPRLVYDLSQGNLRVVSLNVHYYQPDRDDTSWDRRRHAVTAALIDLNPDLVLFQEMETFRGSDENTDNVQRDWVLATVPGYTAGANEPDGRRFPITQPIFYRTDRFQLVDQGWFFFSPTPEVLYSRTWTGSWPSFTSWVLLEETATARRFYVYNTHPESWSDTNQRLGMPLIRDRIASRAFPDLPVLLGGDFNQLGNDPKLAPLAEVGLVRAPADVASFHFQKGWHLYPAIDHVFASPEFQWLGGGAIQKQWEGQWPSDHHPVLAVYRWKTTAPTVKIPEESMPVAPKSPRVSEKSTETW